MTTMARTIGKAPGHATLRAIALFKLTKGVLLLLVGLGAFSLLHRDVAEVVTRWISILRADPDNRYLHALVARLRLLDDRTLEEISFGTFFYAALLLTEGVGLWIEKQWGEVLTIVATSSLIPLELHEFVAQPSRAKLLVIAINVAVVAALVVVMRRNRKAR